MDQVQELEVQDASALYMLLDLCAERVKDENVLQNITGMLMRCHKSRRARMQLEKHINEFNLEGLSEDDMQLDRLVDVLVDMVPHQDSRESQTSGSSFASADAKALPRTITFPYSRHSSYSELCDLVAAFSPKDVYPCTVDEDNWGPHVGMRHLFGHVCSAKEFQHDKEMMIR